MDEPMCQRCDDLTELLNATALMLRGMTMDPAIPTHAKEAMRARIGQIEGVIERRR